jgi:hypothetical protein
MPLVQSPIVPKKKKKKTTRPAWATSQYPTFPNRKRKKNEKCDFQLGKLANTTEGKKKTVVATIY